MRTLWMLVRRTIREFMEDNALEHAAAVAFFAMLSLAPGLVFTLWVLARIWGDEAAHQQLATQMDHLIGGDAARAIEAVLAHAAGEERRGLAAFGIITLLIGGSGVFAQLQTAMNSIWDVPVQRGSLWRFLHKRLLSLAMLVLVACIMLAAVAATALFNWVVQMFGHELPGSGVLIVLVRWASVVALFTALFAVVFKLLPDAAVRWRDVWLGAAVTALLFALGKELIGLYLGRRAIGSAYGAAGSLVVLLTWVYYSCLILFWGAEMTQVYAHWREEQAGGRAAGTARG